MNMDDNFDVKLPFDGPPIGPGSNGDPQQQQQQPSISSFYPLPPMRYIKKFTDLNVRNRCTPLPPKPFTTGSYLMFGQNITIDDMIIRSLESQGLRRLYPREYDHKRELKKINASILVNFLDLIDVLIRCPDTPKREEKCNDLQLLFITMHHLINELRPHQARESIRVCLKLQKKQRQETTMRLLKQIERVQDIIRSAIRNIKDRDINSLLQETLPENFVSLETTSTMKQIINNNQNTTNTLSSSSPQNHHFNESFFSSTMGIMTNGDHVGDQQQYKSSNMEFQRGPLMSRSKMTELDAFMCDLVDEQF